MQTLRTLIVIFFLFPVVIYAQTDTLFWFAAPEVTQTHGDRPIYLRITAISQADVVISQPANPAFVPILQSIPAGSTATVDLTTWIDQIENKPANQALNYGIKISATAAVTAYYEVSTSCACNPEIFALKGSNALGNSFYTPFQTFTDNGAGYSAFDIVATEDNTNVTILPAKDITGHPAGMAFTIVLNAGQTWSGTAVSQLPAQHPAGSLITSNKPIAVTVKDDSVHDPFGNNCADLTGDQLIPNTLIGKQYIVVKGFLNGADRAVILASQNNTDIFIDGNPVPVATLNAGQTYIRQISTPNTFIESSKPVYVMHFSGFGCEAGQPLLPPIQCTGSTIVGFTRSTNDFFGIILITRSGNQNGFSLNGNGALINPAAFTAVPGTGGQWVATNIDLSALVTPGQGNLISNNMGKFHLGIINGSSGSGCRYGYFSDFNTVVVKAGGDTLLCTGNTLHLEADTLAGASYAWQGPLGFNAQTQNPVISNTDVTQSGYYSVVATVDGCPSDPDSILVSINPTPSDPVAADVSLCSGSSASIMASGNGTISWYDAPASQVPLSVGNNFDTPILNNNTTYYVEASLLNCLSNRIPVMVNVTQTPSAPSANGATICSGNSASLTATGTGVLEWYDVPTGGNPLIIGATFITPVLNNSLTYYVQSSQNGCSSPRTAVSVQVNPTPADPISADVSICSGNTATVSASASGNIEWFDSPVSLTPIGTGSSFSTPVLNNTTLYFVEAVSGSCRSNRIPVTVTVNPTPAAPTAADLSICSGETATLSANGVGTLEWFSLSVGGPVLASGNSFTTPVLNTNTNYFVQATQNGCPSPRTHVMVTVNLGPNAPAVDGVDICSGNTATLAANSNGTINWYTSNTGGVPFFTGAIYTSPPLTQNAIYFLQSALNGCNSVWVTAYVTVFPVPSAPLVSDMTSCSGLEATLQASGDGVLNWYDASAGGNLIGTGPTLLTAPLLNNTVVYVQSALNGCLSPIVPLNITIVNGSLDSTSARICSGETYAMPDGSGETEAGDYVFTFSGVNGCDSVIVVHLSVFDLQVEAGPDALTLEEGATTPFQVVVTAPPGETLTYQWSPSNGLSCSDCLNPVLIPDMSTSYEVVVSSQNGCTASDAISVEVIKKHKIFVPNVISPNRDGVNDYLNIYGDEDLATVGHLYVFDRWGNLLYDGKNLVPGNPSDGWDGAYKGKPANPGVYAYYFEITLKDGQSLVVKGDVTLLK